MLNERAQIVMSVQPLVGEEDRRLITDALLRLEGVRARVAARGARRGLDQPREPPLVRQVLRAWRGRAVVTRGRRPVGGGGCSSGGAITQHHRDVGRRLLVPLRWLMMVPGLIRFQGVLLRLSHRRETVGSPALDSSQPRSTRFGPTSMN